MGLSNPNQAALTNEGTRATPMDTQKSNTTITKELSKQEIVDNNQSTIKLIGLDIKTITNEDIHQMLNVERLFLRKNLLVALPKGFVKLQYLRYLDLNSNKLRDIPNILQQCPQLEILDLSCNKINNLPLEISPTWSKNLKVLSLKNNRVSSINDLRIILELSNLNVLEIEGNNIPEEELAMVKSYTPMTTAIPKDEYWAVALRRFFEDHPEKTTKNSSMNSVSTQDSNSKISRASKRMGFISTTRNDSIPVQLQHSPGDSTNDISNPSHNEQSHTNNDIISGIRSPSSNISTPLSSSFASNNHSSNTSNSTSELYNHSKYNDYFKRLSILPEESMANEEARISHAELVAACRKLLFSFTECQQAIRKITSFCKEKAIAVNVVSLLYSVRSHIDNLVEILEQSENEEKMNDQGLIKICVTIISIFKQIMTPLKKHFNIFFEEDDLCFIRMFYMTLLCSYTEIYNAWSFISPEFHSKNSITNKKYLSASHESSALSFVASSSLKPIVVNSNEECNIFEQNISNINNIKHKTRTRSDTVQGKIPSTALIHTSSFNSDNSINEFPSMNSDHSDTLSKIHSNTVVSHNLAANDIGSKDKFLNDSPNPIHYSNGQEMTRSMSVNKLQRSESVLERELSSISPAGKASRSISVSSVHTNVKLSSSVMPTSNEILKMKSELVNEGSVENGHVNPSDMELDGVRKNVLKNSSSVRSSRSNSGKDDADQGRPGKSNIISMQRSDSTNKTQELNEKRNIELKDNGQKSLEENTTTEAQQNIDRQLYEMLINVTKMVSVVYNQLTNEISRTAMASTTGQQALTDELLSKIRGLTSTCCQALDLSKTLNERLLLLISDDATIVEQYLSTSEKLMTWENINAFLKSIISILGSTKIVMADLPSLNEIRPNLASLAKITKDVTVILDLSSYKAVSVIAAQLQKQQQIQQVQQVQQVQQQQQMQQQINSHTHVPLLTPQPFLNSQNSYPFEQNQ